MLEINLSWFEQHFNLLPQNTSCLKKILILVFWRLIISQRSRLWSPIYYKLMFRVLSGNSYFYYSFKLKKTHLFCTRHIFIRSILELGFHKSPCLLQVWWYKTTISYKCQTNLSLISLQFWSRCSAAQQTKVSKLLILQARVFIIRFWLMK